MSAVNSIGIIGAGAMGQGIAQIAAQAGYMVRLFDVREAAITQAQDQLGKIWARQVERGRMSSEQVQQAQTNLIACTDLAQMSDVDLVVEAIVENLTVKQDLFKQLESIVSDTWPRIRLHCRLPP